MIWKKYQGYFPSLRIFCRFLHFKNLLLSDMNALMIHPDQNMIYCKCNKSKMQHELDNAYLRVNLEDISAIILSKIFSADFVASFSTTERGIIFGAILFSKSSSPFLYFAAEFLLIASATAHQ